MKIQKGFTLIELMVVVVIIAILAAIVMPMYSNYVKRGKISEAISNLASLRVSMEQYYQDNRSYEDAATNCGIGAAPAATPNFSYACVATATPPTYTITANGLGSMTGFGYSIDQANNKVTIFTAPATTSGWSNPNPNKCWATKPGGIC